jgi:hypothetical protein
MGSRLDGSQDEDCRWLNPVLVAQIEFLEWTGEGHFRHTKFISLETTNRHACAAGVVDQKSLTRPSLPSRPESRFGVLPLCSFTRAGP